MAKRVLVTCKDCGKQWEKATYSLRNWQGRCYACAQRVKEATRRAARPIQTHKTCNVCGQTKPVTDFPTTGKRRAQCRPCYNEYARKWRAEHPAFVTVTCKDCGKIYERSAYTHIDTWGGRCNRCAWVEWVGRPEQRERQAVLSRERATQPNFVAMLHTDKWRQSVTSEARRELQRAAIKKQGPIPRPTAEQIPRGPASGNWRGGIPLCVDCGNPCAVYTAKRCKRCNSKFQQGANNPSWKGGVAPINKLLRRRIEMREARAACFARDNYTCFVCGIRGGQLTADHIIPWEIGADLRYSVDNLRTVCWSCAQTLPTHAGKAVRIIRRAVAFFTAHPTIALRLR